MLLLDRLGQLAVVVVALLLCVAPDAARASSQTPEVAQSTGSVHGAIVDDTGAALQGATVVLSHDGGPASGVEVRSRADGQFTFTNIPPGSFHLVVSLPGFADQSLSGILAAGGVASLPPIRLTLALNSPVVDVTPTRVEIAQKQIREQEQQRVLGVIPNFFVSYDPNALPLTAGQKFELTWKSHLDPVQFGVTAIVAGLQQARNDFSGFGPGAEGYAKRYAAAYANAVTRSVLTRVLLPTLFKQDPRYFYKGTGSTTSRVVYALSRAVIRKGDNGHWQPNYSGLLGSLGSGALSNVYYPSEDRKSARLTLENSAIGIGGAAVGSLLQEFLYSRITSHARRSNGP